MFIADRHCSNYYNSVSICMNICEFMNTSHTETVVTHYYFVGITCRRIFRTF